MDLKNSKKASGWDRKNVWENVSDNIRKIIGGWIALCL